MPTASTATFQSGDANQTGASFLSSLMSAKGESLRDRSSTGTQSEAGRQSNTSKQDSSQAGQGINDGTSTGATCETKGAVASATQSVLRSKNAGTKNQSGQ